MHRVGQHDTGRKAADNTVVLGSNSWGPRMYVRGVLSYPGACLASSLVTGLRADVIRFLVGATDLYPKTPKLALGPNQVSYLIEIRGYLPYDKATWEWS